MRRPAAVLLALLVTAPACGHRGDPLPPRRRTPPPPQDFRVAQRGDAVEARAMAPTASVDGVPYEEVSVEFLWAEGQKDIEKAGQHRTLPATPGGRVFGSLPLPSAGATVRVAARAVAGGKKGQRTLTVALVARTPPEPPTELTAALAPGGVALSWHGPRPRPAPAAAAPSPPGAPGVPRNLGAPANPPAPATPAPPTPTSPPLKPSAPPARPGETPPAGTREEPSAAAPMGEAPTPGQSEAPRTTGFFVYRRVGGAAYDAPLGDEPLERRALTDALVPVGATACYVVRAVASVQPLVESAPSSEACVEVRDVTPPAAPAGLAVLPREGGLEILWSPSAEPDLAGYRVYRAAPDGEPKRVAEVPPGRASWLDASAQRGVTYRYSVTAFDQAGNESERTEPVEAGLP